MDKRHVKKKQRCYRHPEKPARRKCFHCKRPICLACQVTLDRHIFCGPGCHGVWFQTREERKKPSQEVPGRVVKKTTKKATQNDLQASVDYLCRQMDVVRNGFAGLNSHYLRIQIEIGKARRAAGRFFLAMMVFVLMLAVLGSFFIWKTSGIIPATGPASGTATIHEPPNAVYDETGALLEAPTLDLGTEAIRLEKSKADITGYAPGAEKVCLYLNGRGVAEEAVRGRGFAFDSILLEKGTNIIQVKALDGRGGESYSMARAVERIDEAVARLKTTVALNRQHGPREKAYLSITFDAGSSSKRAGNLLDVLKDKKITTTFFLTGKFIERYPEIVKRIVADGHEVGNHTWSHPRLTTYRETWRHQTDPAMTEERLREELLRTKEACESLTGRTMSPWWRAPYGEHNEQIRRWAEGAGFRHVGWTMTPRNFDLLDWVADEYSEQYRDSVEMLEMLSNLDDGRPGGANGGILLLHLGTERHRDFTDEILPAAIDTLRNRGYQFVTITQMFS